MACSFPAAAERLEGTNSDAASVDGVTRTMPGVVEGDFFNDGFFRSITFDGSEPNFGSGEVLDVDLMIDFRKAPEADPFNNPKFAEIGFALESPTGSVVELVPLGTFSNDPSFDDVTFDGVMSFDDSAATSVLSLSAPAVGTFQPAGLLSSFISENALGEWKLFIEDDLGGHPLEFAAFTLSVETAIIPEPASVVCALLAFCSLLVFYRRLRIV